MRPSTSTFLAALLSLASIEPCHANEGANVAERPRYYFPQLVKRQVDNSWAKKNVIVVPVTVVIGIDGKPTTLSPPTPPQPTNPTAGISFTETTVTEPTSTVEEPSDQIGNSKEPSSGSSSLRSSHGTNPVYPAPTASISESSSTAKETQSSSKPPGLSISLPLPPWVTASSSETLTPSASASDSSASSSETSTSSSSSASSSASSSESSSSESSTGTDDTWTFPTIVLPPKDNTTSSAPTDFPGTGGYPSMSITPTAEPTQSESSSSSSSSSSSDTAQDFPSLTIPSISLPLPTPSQNGTQTSSSSSSESLTSTASGSVTSAPALPTDSITASLPHNGTLITTSSSEATSSGTDSSTRTIPSGIFPPSSAVGTGTTPPKVSHTHTRESTATETASTKHSHSASESSSSSVETSATITSTPTPYPAPTIEETSTTAISTDSETEMIIPTEIIYQPPQPTTTTTETAAPTDTPPALPNVIYSPGGRVQVPPNSVLIQLAFNGSLSYEFILNTADAVTQIFAYLPRGVKYGLDVNEKEVVMESIKPYDTLSELGYTTALNMIYIPENLLGKMTEALVTANSKLYNHPAAPVDTMMSMIDPTFPLLPGGNPPSSGHAPDGGSKPPGSPGGGDDGDDGDENGEGGNGSGGPGGSGKASGVSSTSVGIGLGVVGGAALYGAAMFFVARRYRKKRKMHRRRSSLTSGLGDDEPAYTDNHDASGYRSTTPAAGRDSRNSNGSGSARTQMISAPVMAENSLGWN